MKLLIVFKSSQQAPFDRIAAWVERVLQGETVAIDVTQLSDENALRHYMDWCDKAITIGPFAPDATALLGDKPVLHLFADGVRTDTTIFFDTPENARDLETKQKLVQRLKLFQRSR